jgi:hypothetical protein
LKWKVTPLNAEHRRALRLLADAARIREAPAGAIGSAADAPGKKESESIVHDPRAAALKLETGLASTGEDNGNCRGCRRLTTCGGDERAGYASAFPIRPAGKGYGPKALKSRGVLAI